MIESPSGRVPKKAPRWDLTGTEGCGGGKVFLWLLLMFLGVKEYIGEGTRSGELKGPHKDGGVPYPPGHALLPRGFLIASPTSSPSLLVCFRSKKYYREGFIPFGLRLVFLFCKTLK